MRTASVTDLKARLSSYLREVKRGGEVQILERGVPVARLVGSGTTARGPRADAARRERLIKAGVLRPGAHGGDCSAILTAERVGVPGVSLLDALLEEREEGR